MTWLLFTAIAAVAANVGLGFDLSVDNLAVLYPAKPQNKFTTRCYKDLGCFYTGPPWYHPIYRPVSVPPVKDIETLFYLYTRSNPEKYFELKLKMNKKALKMSPFKGYKPTKVLIHGYAQNYTQLLEVKDELLKYEDYNVIVIDYSKNAAAPYYQAFANSRVNGAQIAQMLKSLMKKTKLTAKNIHIIGRSLGGQMTGFVGERIKGMGRISALDPAGPYFYHMPKEGHVEKTDADFVDIMHTNGGYNVYNGIGLGRATGHADFYPNGGNHMAGCDNKQYLNLTITEDKFGNACSHAISTDYYKNSIRTCKYVTFPCFAYQAFKEGVCSAAKGTNRMGFHATKPPVPLKYYLDTAEDKPYCEVKPR